MSASHSSATARTPTAAAVPRNQLLASLLPSAEPGLLERLEELSIQLLQLHGSELVHEMGQPVEAVIFPVDCVVSIAAGDADHLVDATSVGREGAVGLPGLLGSDVQQTRAVCRVPGQALRLPIAAARRLLSEPGSAAILQKYTRAVYVSLLQRVVCNRSHSSDERSACWLLQTQDRVGAETFALTHATLADMLGVRRATVSDSLTDLQRRGVVRTRRGTVTVLDRPALESASCACYRVVRGTFPTLTD